MQERDQALETLKALSIAGEVYPVFIGLRRERRVCPNKPTKCTEKRWLPFGGGSCN